jgi:hypothetical protein
LGSLSWRTSAEACLVELADSRGLPVERAPAAFLLALLLLPDLFRFVAMIVF